MFRLLTEKKNRKGGFTLVELLVTLAVMTFPAILDATGSPISAWAALIVAIVAAWMGKSLFFVSSAACIVVFLLELVLC